LGTNEYQQSANVFDAGKSFPMQASPPTPKIKIPEFYAIARNS
jgi:hypothetical protein